MRHRLLNIQAHIILNQRTIADWLDPSYTYDAGDSKRVPASVARTEICATMCESGGRSA
jgi:hypothetical protein